ncbi:MAG: hypothetical protein ACR5LC_13245 [Symbiopectobacterium sp.]|uniref:hypothetical protein n=1 Tax=Symbiopectobacterium sp. TaxID=2952789 RepID=UPI003F3543AF
MPGITERREYAELLLDTPRDERASVKPKITKKETKPALDDTSEDIFEQARNLIMLSATLLNASGAKPTRQHSASGRRSTRPPAAPLPHPA